jgi:formate hydrogenlyase subunit 4
MTGGAAASVVVQAAGVVLAPFCVGAVQSLKALLTGRRGAGPLQPYRELRRLWRKTVVTPDGTGPLYRVAPALSAAALLAALVVVPIGAAAPDGPAGRDALVIAGLLATARLAVGLGAFDTHSGFALQGVSRDLLFAAAGDAVLAATLGALAVMSGSTDLRAIAAATAGGDVWRGPAEVLLVAAFALVMVAETGRLPIDNPDTHLELTMIHEAPLLEYAGRDLALLQWSAAARHWLVLVLLGTLLLPHPAGTWSALAVLPAAIGVGCIALAITETMVAKVRIYRAPRMLAVGVTVALLATAARSLGGLG